ncbi:MAG TPA: acyl-CoA dehydrogenase domain-containing protein, partial [Afipia sp.]
GPQNYMGNLYRSVPVAITVEGANILTRNLIVFGQGSVRAHPYLLKEMNAIGDPDQTAGLEAFDAAFWNHVGHAITNFFRAWGRSWTGGAFAPAPDAGVATGYYRQLSRYSTAFALTADMAFLTLGGALKRKEMLSARLGDILSELYLLSAALKRFEDEGRQQDDLPALQWVMANGIRTMENRFAEILANLPNRFVASILKFIVQPFGVNGLGPSDKTVHQCAQLVLEPSAARDRLTSGLYHAGANDDGPLARLERAFLLVTANAPIEKKMRAAHIRDWDEAVKRGIITADEGNAMKAAHEAVRLVVEVDDFAPEALSPIYKKKQSSPERAAS